MGKPSALLALCPHGEQMASGTTRRGGAPLRSQLLNGSLRRYILLPAPDLVISGLKLTPYQRLKIDPPPGH